LQACVKDALPSVRRQALRRNLLPATDVRPCLQDGDASVRFQAATVLGKIGGPADIAPLQNLLADSDAVVRYAAFTALNHIGRAHPDTWRHICAGLSYSNPLIRENTAYALRETYDLTLVEALREIGSPEAVRLLASLHHKKPEWQGEWWAYHPFRATPPAKTVEWAGTPAVMQILRKNLPQADPVIVNAIAEARDAESVPRLRELLEKDHPPDALRALLHAVAALRIDTPTLSRYAAHAEAAVRSAALDALIATDREAALQQILPLLKHSDGAVRATAVAALGRLKSKMAMEPLLSAYKDPLTRNEAIVALAQSPSISALEVYLESLGHADVKIRETARQALRAIRKEALPILKARAVPPELAKELRQVYGNDLFPQAASPEEYLNAQKGDPANGKKLFQNTCIQCHTIGTEGGKVGPDLTTVGAQFSRHEIAESILFPSKAVREGYQAMNIETKDDEFFSGLLKAETADELTLVDSAGLLQRLPKKDIVSRRLSELSLMPEGLHAAFTPSEFGDLLAYLETLR